MTEQTVHEKTGEAAMLSPQQVVDYLREHPDFFVGRDELVRSLTLPHDSGRAISLVERQVHLFREQRDSLRHELVELVSIARQNDRLFEKSKRLLMQVIEARNLADMASVIDDSIRGDFGLDASSLMLIGDEVPAASGALHLVSESDAREQLGVLLDGDRAVCGQFRSADRAFLFPGRDEPVASVALVPLRTDSDQLVGVFAVGSCQPGYFDQSMGSLFLSYISDTLRRLLPPMLQRHQRGEPRLDAVAESR